MIQLVFPTNVMIMTIQFLFSIIVDKYGDEQTSRGCGRSKILSGGETDWCEVSGGDAYALCVCQEDNCNGAEAGARASVVAIAVTALVHAYCMV